ncbi:MAG: BsaWI family type II restriction enzyme [bacterium]|nr:BsaWI family type II restriction enzyme [bacterium]
MKFEDLKNLYLKKKKQYGADAYKHTSELLQEAKELHKRDWLKHPTPAGDHEQSWRAFKGKNLEKLILFMIEVDVRDLGLMVINGNHLERTLPRNLSYEESQVKRRLCIDFGEFGLHLPDVDLIIYNPNTFDILAVLSSKVTLRERIAQTGYWKLKLLQDKATKHIKVYFITPDEDKTLNIRKPAKKGRAIVEVDLDGSYVLTEEEIEESDKVKLFEHFIEDLKRLLNKRQ